MTDKPELISLLGDIEEAHSEWAEAERKLVEAKNRVRHLGVDRQNALDRLDKAKAVLYEHYPELRFPRQASKRPISDNPQA